MLHNQLLSSGHLLAPLCLHISPGLFEEPPQS